MKSFQPAQHFWSDHKNTTQTWIGTDSQQQFVANCAESGRREQLARHGLDRPEAVEYCFNSHGFRCAEFEDVPCFVSLGCSYTAGVGLPVEQTWHHIVSQSLSLVGYNLAVGAGSMDTCARLLYHYVDYLCPKIVLLLRPDPCRLEVFDHNKLINLLPAKLEIPAFQKVWYSNDINAHMNQVKNTLAIEQICASRGIKLVIRDIGADLLLEKIDPDLFPAARDLLHPGLYAQQQCAKSFLKDLI